MASFNSLMIIAQDSGFQNRVKYALQNAALAVMAEVNTTPNHATRVTYANKVLAGLALIFEVTVGVLNNATIAAEADITAPAQSAFAIPDSDIQFAVNSDFNAFAGVST